MLSLLKELESEQTAKAKANFLVKKEQEHAFDIMPDEEVAENLRTVEFEVCALSLLEDVNAD